MAQEVDINISDGQVVVATVEGEDPEDELFFMRNDGVFYELSMDDERDKVVALGALISNVHAYLAACESILLELEADHRYGVVRLIVSGLVASASVAERLLDDKYTDIAVESLFEE